MQTRICSCCKLDFPSNEENFSKNCNGKDGLQGVCRKCANEKSAQYYNEHKEEVSIKRKLRYEKNKEKELTKIRMYYKEHRLQILANTKIYQESRKEIHKQYVLERKDYFKQKTKEYKINNPDYNKMNCQKRKARKNSLLSGYTIEQWEECKKHFNNVCCYCGETKVLTQEHFVPLSYKGEFTINNIIPACQYCNSSKKNKNFFEWYPAYKGYSKKRERTILKYLNYNNGIQQLTFA